MTPLSGLLTVATAVIALQDAAAQISEQSLYNEIIGRPELSQYRAWLLRSQLGQTFDGITSFTVFAPTNMAFQQLSPEKRARFNSMDSATLTNYISSLAMYSTALQTSSMQDDSVYYSHGEDQEKLFIAVKPSVGGHTGVNQYYVNGARIVNSDIRCSNGILHIIDFIPEPASNKYAYGYLRAPDLTGLRISEFFRELIAYLAEYDTIPTLKRAPKMTLFVPSDTAIGKIPRDKLDELRWNNQRLNQVIQRHYILGQAIYTSWAVHKQQFNTSLLDEKITVRKMKTDNYPERTYVMSGGVNAEITFGNITLANGVLHVVDTVLGYIYNSALEQIDNDKLLSSFSGVLRLANAEIKNKLRDQQGSQQVTVFAPTNQAISDAITLPGINFEGNATLVDMVLRYHILESGDAFNTMDVLGQYESREYMRTMVQGMSAVIYRRNRTELFVEAGYVRARIVRSDVPVTNGYVHYIDGVLGIPSKDIPRTICEDDWLHKSYEVLDDLGFIQYLSDQRLDQRSPARTCHAAISEQNNSTDIVQTFPSEFTVFIVNGSAMEYFEQSDLGREIMRDPVKYSWIMRRHTIPGRTIHLDTLIPGNHTFISDNGEEIVVTKTGHGITTDVEVIFARKRAKVIHFDLGATNGVIHVLNDILAVENDVTNESSTVEVTTAQPTVSPIPCCPLLELSLGEILMTLNKQKDLSSNLVLPPQILASGNTCCPDFTISLQSILVVSIKLNLRT